MSGAAKKTIGSILPKITGRIRINCSWRYLQSEMINELLLLQQRKSIQIE